MIDLAAWALLLVPAIVTLVLSVELAAAQWPVRPPRGAAPGRIAIIVPAHDEAPAIGAALAGIAATMPPETRLIVVADNCRDDTAARAGAAGAEVIERNDAERRGKGFALAFARDRLAADPPEVVIVIDADCALADDGIARLATAAHGSGRPVQSAYLMRPRPDLGAMVGLSGFAFLIRNLVRQRGLARLGAPALLTGSGMAFPWPAFAAAPLATDDLVEDLAIGIALARSGHPPMFLPSAATWSDPARRGAALAQRTRWEQGFLRTARHGAVPLIAAGRWPLIWLGLHLLVPPLALLVMLDAVALLMLGGLSLSGATTVPLAIMAALLAVATILLGISWARFGRAQIGGRQLMMIPFYIMWKLPIYAAALFRPERRWVRTRRD